MSIDDGDAGRKGGFTSAERRELVGIHCRDRVLEVELEILERAIMCFARANIVPKR